MDSATTGITMDTNTVLDIIRRLTEIQRELPRLDDIQRRLEIVRHAMVVHEWILISGFVVIVGLQAYMIILSRRVRRAQQAIAESLDSLRIDIAAYTGRVERLEILTGHTLDREDE